MERGCGATDEAILTGESVPVPKKEGDLLLGGSTLVEGEQTVGKPTARTPRFVIPLLV